MMTLRTLSAALAATIGLANLAQAAKPAYFTQTENLQISRDRDNKIVILTGKDGQWMGDIDFATWS